MEMEVRNKEEIVRTACRGCHGGCGVKVHVRDGEVRLVEGDMDILTNQGTMCAMGLAGRELLYHRDRLKYPMKRIGPKASGNWQRISWDEALDTIAARLKKYKNEFGAESVALVQGTGRDYAEFLYRFANTFGTPNVATPGYICYFARVVTHLAICGGLPIGDYDNNPACVLVWGCNPQYTHPEEYIGAQLMRGIRKTKFIVADPRYTTLAARADIWLQLRPGTDAALALGLLNHIINKELYDKEFVAKYSQNFELLRKRVHEYPVKKVAEITWVPEEKIVAAAETYATMKPALIHPGQVLDGSINCVSNAMCMIHLMALSGNLDRRGGDAIFVPPKVMRLSKFALHEKLPKDQAVKRIGGAEYPVAGWSMLTPQPLISKAVLTGKPYPIKAILIHGSNPVITWPNSAETYEALKKVDFLVVTDLFMTPSAELADIVLPAASWLETDDVACLWIRPGYVQARKRIVRTGEVMSDQEILNELGKRLGYTEEFFASHDDALDLILSPSGLTWEKFKEVQFLQGKMEYEKFRTKGFSTPSGKYDFAPARFKEVGQDPLPYFAEPPESPISTPELMEEYPLILITGLRTPVFFHSEGRQIGVLRQTCPEPYLEIHPETATKLGLKEGDWADLESRTGKVQLKVMLTEGIDPRMVAAPHGWWFPEKKGPDYGWRDANINLLVSSDPPYDRATGSVNLRNLLCRVSKAARPADKPPKAGEIRPAPPEIGSRLKVHEARCVECFACEVACNQEHNLPDGNRWIRVFPEKPRRTNGKLTMRPKVLITEGCDLCQRRLNDKQLPSCVQHCIAQCIEYVK